MRGAICDPTSGALGGGGGAALPAGSAQGQILYWNEALGDWAISDAPADGQLFRYNSGTGAVEPVTLQQRLLYTFGVAAVANGQGYLSPNWNPGNAATTNNSLVAGYDTAVFSGFLERVFVRHGNPGGIVADIRYRLEINDVLTGFDLTLSTANTLTSDLVTSVPIAAGDKISWRSDNPGGAVIGCRARINFLLRYALP